MSAFPSSIESIDRMAADAAAIARRRSTPQEVLDRRSQQRLSIAELNSLDIDAVRERFSRLDASDNRPGIVKFLDLIDMPRNMIANAVSRTVLPGVARRADERGEEGTFGVTRITGADLLRGLGLNNRVVSGVGGFAVDILTDPLIFLGGPIKTATVRGARGAVTLGATGQRALRSGLREVGRGGIEAVSNPTTRRLFETAGAARGINVAEGGKDAASALSKAIIGDYKGPLSRVGDAVGLPSSRIGGDLAELTFKTADNAGIARTPEFADYIRATGEFVDEFTLNRGARLGSPSAVGTAIAHIPFTDITVYTPAWTKAGKQAVAQRAIARAQSGDPFTAGILGTQLRHLNAVDTLINDATRSADEYFRNSRAAESTIDDTEKAIFRARNQQIEREFSGIPGDEALGNSIIHAYHGGPRDFDDFDINKIGSVDDTAAYGWGAYFTSSKKSADFYSGRSGGTGTVRDVSIEIRPDELLDWNRPLSEQSKRIQRAVREYDKNIDLGMTGGSFYTRLADGNQKAASNDLLKVGVKGIKYSEVSKAAAGEGSTGFVVFDPSLARRRVEAVPGYSQRINETMDAIRAERLAGSQAPEGFTELGDLLAAAEMAQQVDAKAAQALSLANLRMTEADINTLRGLRRSAEERAGVLVYGESGVPDLMTIVDDLAPGDMREREFEKIVEGTMRQQAGRLADHIDLADEDLELAEQLADMIGTYVTASHEVAAIAKQPIRSTLTGDMRNLVTAASRALGVDRDQIGGLPFASVGSAFRHIGGVDSASVADVMSRSLARAFGGIGGDADAMRAMLTAYSRVGAHDEGAAIAREFIKGGGSGRFGRGIEAIGREAGVAPERMDELVEVVYAMAARRAERSPEYWATRLVMPGEDRAITRHIDKATRVGVLKDASPKIMAELEDLATRVGAYVDELGDFAVAERELNLLLQKDGYLPLSLTDDARRLLQSQKSEGLLQSGGVRGASARQAFQKPRGTWEIRYRDPESGELRTFLEMDRSLYGTLSDNDLLAIANSADPTVRSAFPQIEKIREDIRRFDELFPSAAGDDAINRTRVHGRPLSAIELNEMFESGAFQAITGGVFHGKRLFETNLPKLIAGRTAAARINESRRAFVSAIEPFAVPIQSRVPTGALKPGAVATTRDGQQITVLGGNKFRLGDTVYRPLRQSKLDNLTISPFDHLDETARNLYTAVYPEPLAETIERFAEQLTPERIEGVLKAANDIHRLWRTTTLAHLSWSVVNIIGNALMLGMATARIDQAAIRVANATKAIAFKRNPEKLASMTFRMGEQELTGAELLQLAERYRVTNGGASAEATEHLIGQIADNAAPMSRVARDFPSRMKHRFERSLAESALARKTLGKETRAGRAVDQLKAGAVAFRDEVSTPLVRSWFRVNGGIDDAFRLGLFMHFMDEGSDAASAAAKVRKALFNFGDFTSAESTVMRPIFPFYAWLRASAPNMLEKLFREPRYFAAVPKLQEAIEELAAGENTVPRHMRPRWLQQQLAIQIGTDPELRSAITIGTIIPQEQALRVATGALGAPGALAESLGFGSPFDGTDFMDAADFLLGSLGPAFKVPIDLGTGRESFTGREIGANRNEGDLTLTEYLLGQVRPLKELGVGSARQGALQRSFGEGIGTGVGRLLVGGRLQPHLREERRASSVEREMRDQERRIRRSISVAEREGNEKASLGSRVALLRLYADYMNNGGDPGDVPKWAREQLAQIGALAPQPEAN